MSDNKTDAFDSGAGMWRDYAEQYGLITARVICLRYLDLQARTTDESERVFCQELREAMTMERNFSDVVVYLHNDKFAALNGETDLYDESDKMNRLCAGDIDAAIYAVEYGDGTHDFKTALAALIDQYGSERVNIVLAAEAKWLGFMEHIPGDTYQWARGFNLGDHFYGGFHLRTRSDVLCEFIACVREAAENTCGAELAASVQPEGNQIYTDGAVFWCDLTQASVSMDAALQTGGKYIDAKMRHECSALDIRVCRELFVEMSKAAAEQTDPAKSVYFFSYSLANKRGETELYNNNRRLNSMCARAIDDAIHDSRYKPNLYNLELAAMKVVHEYGFSRVNKTLAKNIQALSGEGQDADPNIKWARNIYYPAILFDGAVVNSHTSLLLSFTEQTRKLCDFVDADRAVRQCQPDNEKPSVLQQIKDAQKVPPTRNEKTPEQRKNKGDIEH